MPEINIDKDKIDFQIDEEFKSYLPVLKRKEFQELRKSIKREGCREPLIIWDEKNTLIDGYHRLAICQELDKEFDTKRKSFQFKAQVIAWIVENQLGQRNLNEKQYDYYLGKRQSKDKLDKTKMLNKGDKSPSSQFATSGETAKKIAKEEGVNKATIYRAQEFAESVDKISQNVGSEFRTIALSQEAPLSKSATKEIVGLDETEQEQIVNIIDSGEKLTQKDIKQIKSKETKERKKILDIMSNKEETLSGAKREVRKEKRQKKAKRLAEKNKTLPKVERKYQLILADPPWQYEHPISDSRKIENQYPTMKLEDIKRLSVEKIINDDAYLYLWVPSALIAQGLEVVKAWDFNYRTNMVWVKDRIGMGYYTRQRHELILIGKKGDPPVPEGGNTPDSVIEAPRKEHSKKPEIIYDIIEETYPNLAKMELFARQEKDNWDVWGNEI